jgi:hypothetical protein
METKITEQIQHRFSIREDDGTEFSDALYFPVGGVPDAAALEALRAERLANWKAVLALPPREPTPEELLARIDAMVLDQERLDTEVSTLTRAEYDAARVRLGLEPRVRTR